MKLALLDIRTETPRASTFRFASDASVIYEAGQHVSVMLPIAYPDSRGKVRQFTVSSSPTEKGIIAFTTKKGSSSFKQALFTLKKGDHVEARGPGGGFTVRGKSEPLVFLAGGIGITPFRAIIRYLYDMKDGRPVTLIFSEKTPHDFSFRTELDDIAHHMPSLSIMYTITQPEGYTRWKGRVGRIDAEFIKISTKDMESVFYICGPALFVEAMLGNVKGIGVSDDRILVEKFPGY